MNKLPLKLLGSVFMTVMASTGLQAANGVCFHCEEIREYNKEHNKNYEYYEDYLKEQKNGSAESHTSEEQQSNNNPSNSTKKTEVNNIPKPVKANKSKPTTNSNSTTPRATP